MKPPAHVHLSTATLLVSLALAGCLARSERLTTHSLSPSTTAQAPAADPGGELPAALETEIPKLMDEAGVPGLAVALGRNAFLDEGRQAGFDLYRELSRKQPEVLDGPATER